MATNEEKFDAFGLSYSRESFEEWLLSLPPDLPFCGEGDCPISAYFVNQGAPRGLIVLAVDADRKLVARIDTFAKDDRDWSTCTPKQILDIIDDQEKWEANE